MKTKLYRTLEILKKSGYYGIHSFPLMKEAGTTRVAARVNDLKKQGHIIESKKETYGGVDGCRYFYKGFRGKEVVEVKKPIRWEYNMNTNTATPIYA